MDPVRNPYSPGAGRPPAALVGRDPQRERWRVSLDRVEAGRTAQPVVLYGLRGVGKTVLLTRFFNTAQDRNWIVAQVEGGAGKSLREALGEALHAPLADLARPSAGKRLLKGLKTALSFKASYDTAGTWNFGLDLTETAGGGADTGMLETDLNKLVRDLSAAAEEEGAGLAILIDEAQDLTAAELTAVCSAAHVTAQNGWSALFALAGLPSLPRVLAEAKSYAERLFVFERIEHLTEDVARRALTEPAAIEGVAWDDDAITFVVAGNLRLPVLPPAVRPGHVERCAWSRNHACRCPSRCSARTSCPRRRLLPRSLGPRDPSRAAVPARDGVRRRRRQLIGRCSRTARTRRHQFRPCARQPHLKGPDIRP